MTQSIMVQVGQCGNQIGCRFWDLALREHANVNQTGMYDDSLSSFFRNVDTKGHPHWELNPGSKIASLKARAVLIDMEEGVLKQLTQGPLGDLFHHQRLVKDISGSGNNWAVGNLFYGSEHRDLIVDTVRQSVEQCDCLQSFFILHSMGGGTGSGLGTSVLSLLRDEYPDVYRFVVAVYPSQSDDVVTSPYNSVLAMNQLSDKADCVLPVENDALIRIVDKITASAPKRPIGKRVEASSGKAVMGGVDDSSGGVVKKQKAFDAMNNVVANLLLNLTSSARFEGSLNVDINEITTNLVPFPRLHYLTSSTSPLYTVAGPHSTMGLDRAFTEGFSREHQLLEVDPARHLYLACAALVRGRSVEMSDLRRNVDRMTNNLRFVHWNREGWKTGLCSVPPVGGLFSLLVLANNTCIKNTFCSLEDSFVKLYRRKAHVHHYTKVDGFEKSFFDDALESLRSQISEYTRLERDSENPPKIIPRLQAYPMCPSI